MPGISDVAELAGVSKATASRALSGTGYVSATTRARVVEAATSLGYVPSTSAQSLATGRTRAIGVVMPYLNRWFFAELLEGIQATLLDHGRDLTLYDATPGSAARERIFDELLSRKRFDGLIAVALEPGDHELERLLRIGCPVVSMVGQSAETSVVELDDHDAVRRAVEHLVELGHSNIAFIGGGDSPTAPRVERRRHRAYASTMRQLGLGEHVRRVPTEATLPAGYQAAVDVLGDSRSRPTAIVAICDEVAIGTIIAARRLGIAVPSALSIIGIDDHDYAEMFSLTTLRQDPRAQGQRAVEILLDEIEHPDVPRTSWRPQARMIMRNSTGARAPRTAPLLLDTAEQE